MKYRLKRNYLRVDRRRARHLIGLEERVVLLIAGAGVERVVLDGRVIVVLVLTVAVSGRTADKRQDDNDRDHDADNRGRRQANNNRNDFRVVDGDGACDELHVAVVRLVVAIGEVAAVGAGRGVAGHRLNAAAREWHAAGIVQLGAWPHESGVMAQPRKLSQKPFWHTSLEHERLSALYTQPTAGSQSSSVHVMLSSHERTVEEQMGVKMPPTVPLLHTDVWQRSVTPGHW